MLARRAPSCVSYHHLPSTDRLWRRETSATIYVCYLRPGCPPRAPCVTCCDVGCCRALRRQRSLDLSRAATTALQPPPQALFVHNKMFYRKYTATQVYRSNVLRVTVLSRSLDHGRSTTGIDEEANRGGSAVRLRTYLGDDGINGMHGSAQLVPDGLVHEALPRHHVFPLELVADAKNLNMVTVGIVVRRRHHNLRWL